MNIDICKPDLSYAKEICPSAGELHEKTFLGFAMCLHELSDKEKDLIVEAFRKVWDKIKRQLNCQSWLGCIG